MGMMILKKPILNVVLGLPHYTDHWQQGNSPE
jgi:hypothetical protein